jgi:hypothetical protein
MVINQLPAKSALSSTTVQGAVIAAVPVLTEIFNHLSNAAIVLPLWGQIAVGALGFVLTVIGRVKAERPIKLF